MPFLLAEILNFQGSTHRIGVGSFSYVSYTLIHQHYFFNISALTFNFLSSNFIFYYFQIIFSKDKVISLHIRP